MKSQGTCLCGSVQLQAEEMDNTFGVCHCDTCRKWGGGPMMTIKGGTDVSFKGAENITVFNSSDWAERGFCKKCGTHLFYRLKKENQYFLPFGLMDNTKGLTFSHQIFIDKKPENYNFANQTHTMTGAEVFAMFAAPQ